MVKVCVIGAGPCGMSALYQFGQMDNPPDIICYEKQETWGGLWNLTWRTGTDQFGEPVHGGMYKYLWSNSPKECIEYPYYTFVEHFKKPIPSFPPRAVLRDYLEGRCKSSKVDLKKFIKFKHVVRSVQYREKSDDFLVIAENLLTQTRQQELFSHVIVATGIFNVPDVPSFPGLDTFNGRIMHSHDFRDAHEFKNKRVLVVGSSYSAEDIALQCVKYGAKKVIYTWRTKPMGFKWPKEVEERPLVQSFKGNEAHFSDGSTAEIDAIILCTGYKYHFPYMENDLRLYSGRSLYPDNLYKGTLWLAGGNNKVFYLGTQLQYYTYTMFDAEALWVCKYIMGKLDGEPKQQVEMQEDVKKWLEKLRAADSTAKQIEFQTEFMLDLCERTGYDVRCTDCSKLWHAWVHCKEVDILTYRDQSFQSVYTKLPSAKHEPWFTAYDDSLENFIKA